MSVGKFLQRNGFQATVCFTDLDQGNVMIILELNLTFFIASILYLVAAGAAAKIVSSLKSNHHKQI